MERMQKLVEDLKPFVSFRDKTRVDTAYETYKFFEELGNVKRMERELLVLNSIADEYLED